MTTPTTKPPTAPAERRAEQTHLSRRYGNIGIEAVAAAARYIDRRMTPAQVQTAVTRIDLRFVESAV